jgi:hypothetical protein
MALGRIDGRGAAGDGLLQELSALHRSGHFELPGSAISDMARSGAVAGGARVAGRKLRRRIYELLEHGPVGNRASQIVNSSIIALIVISLLGVILESEPALEASYSAIFTAIEAVALVVFSIEFCVRVWIAVEHAPRGISARSGHVSPL